MTAWASSLRAGAALALMLGLVPTMSQSQGFDATMANRFADLQRAVSAIRVDTRQDSLGAEQAASASANAAMGLASAIVEQETALATHAAVSRYESMQVDPVTGLCAVADAQVSVGQAAEAGATINDELAGFEERWLERGGDRADTLVAIHRMRRTVFCSSNERRRGLCDGVLSFGVPAAGDSDASPFLLRRSYGSAELDVGTIYVDTVAPFPTILSSEAASSGSVSDMLERAQRRRELALVALARAGLTDVLVRGLEGGVAE